jgi:hypothetical protein
MTDLARYRAGACGRRRRGEVPSFGAAPAASVDVESLLINKLAGWSALAPHFRSLTLYHGTARRFLLLQEGMHR